MNNIKVNINVQAKVVLTDYGKQILTDYYDKLGAIYYLDKKEFVFPLWQIASIFGDCLYISYLIKTHHIFFYFTELVIYFAS